MWEAAGQLYVLARLYAGPDRGRGGDHLERGSRRVLTLGDPVQDRLAVAGAEQLPVLRLGDAAGPDGRVVAGQAGHRDHPPGRGQHHRRPRGGARVALLPGLGQRVGQDGLHISLQLRVDAGHQVIAGLRGDRADGAELLAGAVHREHVPARGALQLLVVLQFQPGLSDQVLTGETGGRQVLLLHLLRGDRAQVPEHLRRVGSVRRRVPGHRVHPRADPGELVVVLHDLHRHPVRDVLRHRDGLVRRAGPARLADVRVAQPEFLVQPLVRHVQQAGQPGQHRRAAVALRGQVHDVHRDHQRAGVVHQWLAAVVQDLAAHRGRDDRLCLVQGGQLRVVLARQHLQVPQAAAERNQQRGHHRVQHDEAPP